MIRLFVWLSGSKVGRWLAAALLLIFTGLVIAARFYSKGKSAEKSKQTEEALRRLRERMKSDADIGLMPAADRRKRLSDDWFN